MFMATALVAASLAGPCSSPDRTLACPDLIMRKPYNMRLIRSEGRQLLAATNAIVNIGEGPLEIRARRMRGQRAMTTRQVLRPASPGGRARVLPATGRSTFFDTGTRGTYWKYDGAASFTLRPVAADGTVGKIRRTGPKVDYCFRDLRKVRDPQTSATYPRTPRGRVFGACSQDPDEWAITLGTSVGWADIYPYDYPQNAIDVTGLTGCFLYTLKSDPRDELEELREDNNTGSVIVRLPWRGPGARGCASATPAQTRGS